MPPVRAKCPRLSLNRVPSAVSPAFILSGNHFNVTNPTALTARIEDVDNPNRYWTCTGVPLTSAVIVPLFASLKLNLIVPTGVATTDDESNDGDWYDDPAVGIRWPVAITAVSPQDEKWPPIG